MTNNMRTRTAGAGDQSGVERVTGWRQTAIRKTSEPASLPAAGPRNRCPSRQLTFVKDKGQPGRVVLAVLVPVGKGCRPNPGGD